MHDLTWNKNQGSKISFIRSEKIFMGHFLTLCIVISHMYASKSEQSILWVERNKKKVWEWNDR